MDWTGWNRRNISARSAAHIVCEDIGIPVPCCRSSCIYRSIHYPLDIYRYTTPIHPLTHRDRRRHPRSLSPTKKNSPADKQINRLPLADGRDRHLQRPVRKDVSYFLRRRRGGTGTGNRRHISARSAYTLFGFGMLNLGEVEIPVRSGSGRHVMIMVMMNEPATESPCRLRCEKVGRMEVVEIGGSK